MLAGSACSSLGLWACGSDSVPRWPGRGRPRGYLAAFARRAEDAGYASLWSFQRLLVPEGSGMEPVYRSVLDPMVALGYAGRRDLADQARRGRDQPAVRLPGLPGQAGRDRRRAVRRPARPRAWASAGCRRNSPRRARPRPGAARGPRSTWPSCARCGPMRSARSTASSTRSRLGGRTPGRRSKPGPPVLLGGMSRPAMERAGRIAEGWITSSRADLSKISEAVSVIREAASAAGRDPDAVRIICRGVVLGARRPRAGRRPPAAVRQLRADPRGCRVARRAGGDRAVLRPNWDPQVGTPAVAPQAAAARAEEILTELAPARRQSP